MNTTTSRNGTTDNLEAVVSECERLSVELGADDWARNELAELRADLGRDKPEILLYGPYNAGKSTLANALLGTDRAKIGAAPTTATVASYDMGDFRLLDSPGIDAPHEHERLAKQRLARVDCVLFLLADDGQIDEQEIVMALSELLIANIPTVVVFNNHTMEGAADRSFRAMTTRLREALAVAVDAETIAGLAMLMVNARAAWDGVRQAEPGLVAASGLQMVRDEVERRALASAGSQLRLPALRRLLAIAVQLRDTAQRDVGGPAATFFGPLLAVIEAEQSTLCAAITTACDRQHSACAETILAVLRSDSATIDLNQAVAPIVSQLDERLDALTRQANERLDRRLEDLTLKWTTQLNVPASHEASSVGGDDEPSAAGLRPSKRFKSVPISVDAAVGWANSAQGAKQIEQGLLALRNLKFPVLKGVAPKTLAKWSGRIGKGMGVGLPLAIAVWEWVAAGKQQQKQRAQLEAAQTKLNLRATEAARDFLDGLAGEANAQVMEALGDLRQVVLAQQTQAQSSQATQLRAAAALMSVGRRAETMIARLERS